MQTICAYAKCSKPFSGRRNQRFCSPRCSARAHQAAKGTRRDWMAAAMRLADLLRQCVVQGILPAQLERRASAALRAARPHREPIRAPRRGAKRKVGQ